MKKIDSKFWKINWIHLLVWSIFISYEVLVVGIAYGDFGNPITYTVHYFTVISYFYFLSKIGLPWALRHGKNLLWRLPLVLTIAITYYILLNFFEDTQLVRFNVVIRVNGVSLNHEYILKELYRCIYILGFASGYYFLKTSWEERKKSQELEEQRLIGLINEERMARLLEKTQNDFLKAQINPHFLFNTLNFVYHNMESNPSEAGEAILILSDIMRYAIDAGNEGSITLGGEMEQVKKLLFLYQLRKNKTLNIDIFFTDEVHDLPFIPLVLLTLMENIFKHGNLNKKEDPALMAVYLERDVLYIQTSNLVNSSGRKIGTNNGMKNIESRLRAAFGDSVIFEFALNQDQQFVVNVLIPLKAIDMSPVGNQNIEFSRN